VVSYNNTKILHTVIRSTKWKYEEWKIRSGHQSDRMIDGKM